MARETLTEIIANLRLKVGDQDSVFSDDDIEKFLDQNSFEFDQLTLVGTAVQTPSSYEYKVFKSTFVWEKSAKFSDPEFIEITPNETKSNFLLGRFEFDVSQNEIIYISGNVFDLNSAAADLCDAWAAKEKLSFDFSADAQSYKESQKFAQLKEMATGFRINATIFGKGGRASVGTAPLKSGDWNAVAA